MTQLYKTRVCGRALAEITGSNHARGRYGCVVFCTVRTKGKMQDSMDKELWIKYTDRTKENSCKGKNIPSVAFVVLYRWRLL